MYMSTSRDLGRPTGLQSIGPGEVAGCNIIRSVLFFPNSDGSQRLKHLCLSADAQATGSVGVTCLRSSDQ